MSNESRKQNPLENRVLVLNGLYMPIRVVSAKKAVIMLHKEKVEVITVKEESYLNFSFDSWKKRSNNGGIDSLNIVEYIHTPSLRIAVPRIVRLYNYRDYQNVDVQFNRKNVFVRDDHTCQYCGEEKPESRLSIDHVIPRSRDGKSSWTNVVTACKECNVRKGERLLENTDMNLLRQPSVPSHNPIVKKRANQQKYKAWQSFLDDAPTVVRTS
jgi:5-methylcytosine-specific restriction endonuclease McrA